MPNTPLKMNKLRTIIRLYTERVGLRAITEMARTSRNTVKKYVNIWNSLSLSYEAFIAKSDSELYSLFCVVESPAEAAPRMMHLTECLRLIRELNMLNHQLRANASLKIINKLKSEGKRVGSPRGRSSELRKKVTQVERLL